MYDLRRLLTPLICLGVFFLMDGPAWAQTGVLTWNAGVDTYNNALNWDDGFGGNNIPSASFSETGFINNGGTAFVTDVPPSPSGIVLGEGSDDSGTLEIRSGGSLTVTQDQQSQDGNVVVGQSGTGHLIVKRGGTLTAEALRSGGRAESSVVLGEIGGSGTANVMINGQANFGRNTHVIGPNVNFMSQSLSLTGSLTAEITGTDHSTLMVNDSASVAGSLIVEFNNHTPALGESWNLVDAATIQGSFGSITSNFSPGAGRELFASAVPGGTNGTVLRLQIEQILGLSVDRASGAVTINNLAGGAAVELDGYSILSAGGSLDENAWMSLQDQSVGGFREGNPSSAHLSELDPLGSSTFVGGTTFELGNIYRPNPSEFGQETEDVVFQYARPSDGATFLGEVEYSGFGINNLVLRIDPETGRGFLVNESPFSIDIDGYSILSDSGALQSGEWDNLEAQSVGDWRASADSDNSKLSELNPLGETTLEMGTTFDLGTLFDPNGARDLTLEFVFPGDFEARHGIVAYELAPPPTGGIEGDYNDNGEVELGDLNLVLFNWNEDGATLPGDWINMRPPSGTNVGLSELNGVLFNWGNMVASTASVPEPSAIVLCAVAILAIGMSRRGQR